MVKRRFRNVTDRMLDEILSREDSMALVLYAHRERRPPAWIENVLDHLASEYAGLMEFLKIDLAENPSVAAWAGISVVPTVVLYVQGKENHRCTQPTTKHQIGNILKAIFPDMG